MSESIIIRLPNWVGDVVMTLPSLYALKSLGFNLHLLGKPWVRDLLAAVKDINFVDLESGILANKKKMTAINANYTLLLTNSFSSAFIAWLARKNTIGYKKEGRQMLLSASLSKPNNLHEVEYFWHLTSFALMHWFSKSVELSKVPAKIHLPLTEDALIKAKKVLSLAHIKQPFWVLCPFAHGRGKQGESKIWPHWHEFSKNLENIVVCPSKNEEALCANLVPKAMALPGLNLMEYAAILSLADGVIANDSGPMHIAAAVGTKTLGLFGSTCPKRTHPWGGLYLGHLNHWPTIQEVLVTLENF